MNRMASLRRGIQRSLSSCSGSAVRLGKTSQSTSYRAPPACGSVGGAQCGGSEICGPKVNRNATRSAFSAPRDSATSAPFASKCSASAAIPGARCYASRIARLPGELAVIQSLMPYYSATADSRLVSRLGTSGDAAILQGTLTHISPDL